MNGLRIVVMLLVRGRFRLIYASLRRRWLVVFRPGYVAASLAGRRGSCTGEGHCCGRTTPWCGHFKAGKCGAYDRQPRYCRIFPIDGRDQELSGVKGLCGYRFTAISG